MKKILKIFLLLMTINSSALCQEQDVKKFIEDIGNRIIKIAGDKNLSPKIKKEKIVEEVDLVVDSAWISRFTLGKNYQNFSEIQNQKFKELYRQFMINTYGPKFGDYNGKKFVVVNVFKEKIFYVAKCEFLPIDSNKPILIDFRVKQKDGKFVIIDFVAEGVSLIETQRSEFDSAISQNGIDNFLKDFEKKVSDLKNKK